MALKQAQYNYIRKDMRPGDIIAFSGKGHFSEIIKWATRSNVSHVGIVYASKVFFDNEAQKGTVVDVIESTTMYTDPATGKSISGVQRNRLSDHVKYYDGVMWWLPLSRASREKLDIKKFIDFLLHQDDKEYDMPQAVHSSLDLLDPTPLLGRATYNQEDFSQFFCSELATAALEAGKVINNINASEVTPIDLCSFALFAEDYYQIKGGKLEIKNYNRADPEGFGFVR